MQEDDKISKKVEKLIDSIINNPAPNVESREDKAARLGEPFTKPVEKTDEQEASRKMVEKLIRDLDDDNNSQMRMA